MSDNNFDEKIPYVPHDYSDKYYLKKNPNPHFDFPLKNTQVDIKQLENENNRPLFLIAPKSGKHLRITLQELAQVYESQIKSPDGIPQDELLLTVAEKIYSVARDFALKPDEPDDHGFGKDCEKYSGTFEGMLTGEPLSVDNKKYLLNEIDTVISGCHSEIGAIPDFIETTSDEGWNLLEAKFHWDQKESLWQFYLTNWEGKSSFDRQYIIGK